MEFTPSQREMMEKAGLTEEDFEKKPVSDNERISILEDAVLELGDIIGEVVNG